MVQEKTKLLFVTPASDLGGTAQYILSIVRYLPHERFDMHIAVCGNGALCEAMREQGVAVHGLPVDYSVFSFWQAVLSLRKFLRRENFDVIHAHNAKAGFLSVMANRNLPARIVYTGHGFRFDQKKNLLSRIGFFCLEWIIVKSSTHVTVLSEGEHDFGLEKGLLDFRSATVTPMSIDVNMFADIEPTLTLAERTRLGIPPDAFVVGMIGRVTLQKDPETFVKAAAILNSRIENAYFVWVGDGDAREDTRRLANDLGLSDKFVITGHKDSDAIPKLLAAMDVVLFTSRFEGLPIALLEAMAAKRFVVAANVGSIGEIVKEGETGWLFGVGDYKQAASIVETIHQNRPGLDYIRMSAFDLVAERHSPRDRMARQYQSIYENVSERKSSENSALD
jgi:glycosyltransferase involved in cell wall biosynthesis